MEGYSYATTPGKEAYYDAAFKYASPTPTPSPRGPAYYAQTPQRPATRAHFRGASTGFEYSSPRPTAFSPRYTSDGQYATNAASPNVSGTRSSRKHSFSTRRNSDYARHRTPDYGSEDEYIEVDGVVYVLRAGGHDGSRRRNSASHHRYQYPHHHQEQYGQHGHATDSYYYVQTPTSQRRQHDETAYESPRYEEQPPPPRRSHSRRMSSSTPQRPQTVRPQTARPTSSHKKSSSSAVPNAPRKATKLDAEKHRIPAGYSLKNWDPSEEPILLLGSVFDANNLGKWVYDWTVYVHGSSTPISDMAGELWLLLINLAGKVKRAEEVIPRIRARENRELIEDFVVSGERLMDKLRKLLKACEQPMLEAAAESKKKSSSSSSKKDSALGKNSGVEFVETLFGRERELAKTERFMQSIRLWKLRFDANCEDVLADPTM